MGWLWGSITSLVITALNGLLAAFGAVINGILSILPAMPSLPTLPTPFVTAESWVAWFFPVDTLVNILITVSSLWVLWYVVSWGLRWARAINS